MSEYQKIITNQLKNFEISFNFTQNFFCVSLIVKSSFDVNVFKNCTIKNSNLLLYYVNVCAFDGNQLIYFFFENNDTIDVIESITKIVLNYGMKFNSLHQFENKPEMIAFLKSIVNESFINFCRNNVDHQKDFKYFSSFSKTKLIEMVTKATQSQISSFNVDEIYGFILKNGEKRQFDHNFTNVSQNINLFSLVKMEKK